MLRFKVILHSKQKFSDQWNNIINCLIVQSVIFHCILLMHNTLINKSIWPENTLYTLRLLIGTNCLEVHVLLTRYNLIYIRIANCWWIVVCKEDVPASTKTVIIFDRPLSWENLVYHMTMWPQPYEVLLLAWVDNFNEGTPTL